MRRFSGSHLFLFSWLGLATILAGCGGGNSANQIGPVATVTVAPSPASMDIGTTLGFAAIPKDAAGHVVLSATVTWASSNPAIQISNNGLVCGGTWDSVTTPVVCTPAAGPTTTTITATAGGITSAPATLNVHRHITNITLTPASPACVSQGQSLQYTATAFSGAVALPASEAGAFNFSVGDAGVATILSADQPAGQPTNQITAKGKNSGQTTVVASNSGTTSLAATFTTCPPAKISLHVASSTATALSLAVNAAGSLAADVTDTNGNPITGLVLTYASSTNTANVSASGVVTGVSAGQTTITASCSPATCNQGLNFPVYSNPVAVTVTGTANSTVVFVTSTEFTTQTPVVLPISTSNNTVGTAIALPDITVAGVATKSIPNSMILSQTGGRLFVGTNNGLMIIDALANTVLSTITSAPGKVISASPNAVKIIVADSTAGKTYIIDNSTGTFETLNAVATAAAWTPDNLKAYIVAGTTLFQYSPIAISLRTIAIGDTGRAVDLLPGAQFAYIATSGGNLGARATCRNDATYAPESTISTDTGLQFLRGVMTVAGGTTAVPKMLDVGGTKMTVDTPTLTDPAAGTSCPPGIASNATSADWSGLGVGAFTPRQLIALNTGAKAFVTSDQALLLGYDVAANTTFTVATSGASLFTGGATLDGSKVYAGGSDGAVHVIDTATNLQTATIAITFSGTTTCAGTVCRPDLVVVQPR
jgi:trimeric autotransporter adhesin